MLGLKWKQISKKGLLWVVEWFVLCCVSCGLVPITHQGDVILALWCLILPATRTFVQKFVQANYKATTKALHYWSIMPGINQMSMASPHKGQLIHKSCPCYDVIYVYQYPSWLLSYDRVNHAIAPVLLTQPWEIWANGSHESPENERIVATFKTKQGLMMTSSIGNIFRATGPLRGASTC